MKTALFLFGTVLIRDDALNRYIERHLQRGGYSVMRTFKAPLPDESLLEELRRLAPQSAAVLVCTEEHLALLSRLLCTLSDDALSAENDRLAPSRARRHPDGAYTLLSHGLTLHVLPAAAAGELPALPEAEGAPEHLFMLFDVEAAEAEKTLKPLAESHNVSLSLLPQAEGWLKCLAVPAPFGDAEGFTLQAAKRFTGRSILTGDIVAFLIETLSEAKRSVTFAESCTGGLLSAFFTRESGASAILEGALVTYSNRLKSAWIAVEEETLKAHGAVSAEVVAEMSAGALEVSAADYAVAVSGIAGPEGGSPEKPVGTVYVAVRSRSDLSVKKLQLSGDRNYIQEQSVLHAVAMLIMIDKTLFFKNV